MPLLVHYEPSTPRPVAVLHAWHPERSPWHIEAAPGQDGRFTFVLEHDVSDPREIHFKLMFPREGDRWERDDFVRRVPTTFAAELWTFDFSPRCLTVDPYEAPPPDRIVFQAITRRFAGGAVFVWEAGGERSHWIGETARDEGAGVSRFETPLEPWMRGGFHFKLVDRERRFEADRHNRVWRPSDGGDVWLKSGHIDLAAARPPLETAPVELIYPNTLGEAPKLSIVDDTDDFQESLSAVATEALDELFQVSTYHLRIYRDALYQTRASHAGADLWNRPFRLLTGMPIGPSVAVAGASEWLQTWPLRSAVVDWVVHPNPQSEFGPSIDWNVSVGSAPSHETVTASQRADGAWRATLRVFPDLPHEIAPRRDAVSEHRPDGELDWRRRFVAPPGGPTALHTADGIAGVARRGGPDFVDVNRTLRRDLMAAAYSEAIASAGVFEPWEMPHGATPHGDAVWFVLHAPHAMCADLLLLQSESGPRTVSRHPMTLTHDLRYWWCRVPKGAAPHGAPYRFLLNDEIEVIDPAGRWAFDPGRLWCKPDEGKEGPWTRVVDPALVRLAFDGASWRTMGWESLVIYEMHPKRFTRRNANASSAFDQIIRELAPGGYLNRLRVTALELLPVHEFPRDLSWGYNPSLFFAVDSAYGGPEELARCVRACHDAGRAALLDVVFNHMNESPLETLARDVYVSGETNWGAMVHYAHPACRELFRQALVYLWHTFRLDGFRFDATGAIIDGHQHNPYILRQPGNGRGWEFLGMLRHALRRAADAAGEPWPYLVAENDPSNWGLSDARSDRPGVLDGQWHFEHHYRLNDAARNRDDKADEVREQMEWPHRELRPFYEATRFAESHDSTSDQEDWKQRIVRHEAWGLGRRMAKAAAAAVILAKGVPMLFMGQEAGEDIPFHFGMDDLADPTRYLRLDDYLAPGEMNRIFAWCNDLLGLRNNPHNGLQGDDDQSVRSAPKTLAFVRRGGRFFVAIGLGTPHTVQNLGWLGLPSGAAYKEIFNSSWPVYRMDGEEERTNGSYDAHLTSADNLNLPSIGAVVLERR